MAKVSDIDTEAAVSRYIGKPIVASAEQEQDTALEIRAVLDSVATSFLLSPASALPIILKSKNALLQVATSDLDLIDFFLDAIEDLDNTNNVPTDLSDLLEAKTALIELETTGRIDSKILSLDRYEKSINRFLDKELAKLVKPRKKLQFERTGIEARQDIFRALSTLDSLHAEMAVRIDAISGSVEDFRSAKFVEHVSPDIISRVSTSLDLLKERTEEESISNTSLAIELLTGLSSLKSISDAADILDPYVRTGKFPTGRTITADSSPEAAAATSSDSIWTVSIDPTWKFNIAIDGATALDLFVPAKGDGADLVAGNAFVSSGPGSATYNIPVSGRLYVRITPSPGRHDDPDVYGSAGDADTGIIPIDLTTTGPAVPFATVLSEIDAELGSIAGGGYARCVEFAEQGVSSGTNRFLIYGKGSTTKIEILETVMGVISVSYVSPPDSTHTNLGFDLVESLPINDLDVTTAKECLEAVVTGVTFDIEDDAFTITSNTTTPSSKLRFDSGSLSEDLGFTVDTDIQPSPTSIVLKEGQLEVTAESLGISVGSRAIVGAITTTVESVSGSTVNLTDTIVPALTQNVTIDSAPSIAVQKMITSLSALGNPFLEDITKIKRVANPLLSTPVSEAFRADAIKVLNSAKVTVQSLTSILSSDIVPPSQSPLLGRTDKILDSLRERGVDRGEDLLLRAKFSLFSELSPQRVSKSGRLLTAIEDVGSSDFTINTTEEQWEEFSDDSELATSDDEALPEIELSEPEDIVNGR